MTNTEQPFYLRLLNTTLRHFLPNSQAVALMIILMVSFGLIYYLSDLLMPVFAAIVLAYLLESIINKAEQYKTPRLLAVYLVFFSFLTCLGFLLFFLMPIISEQAIELVQHIPSIINRAQTEIMRLPNRYPQFISESKMQAMLITLQQQLLAYSENIVSFSAASLVGIISAIIYLFLVPMMVFLFLKDKQILIHWLLQFIPKEQHLTVRVWHEIDQQIGNYVRGKLTEVVILWLISYITFYTIDLNYAMLLSVLMGLSVIIPYVGATLVTFPVLGVAYFQWGLN
ncbi:MAG: AI-2E family transporter, partial [Methylococcaceae bacterium]